MPDGRRGAAFIGVEIDPTDRKTLVLTWRVWATDGNGRVRTDFVSVSQPDLWSDLPSGPQTEKFYMDSQAFLNYADTFAKEAISEAQDGLEAGRRPSWDGVPNSTISKLPPRYDPNYPHVEGKCGCGITHPPHFPSQPSNAPMCWCGQYHEGVGTPR